LKAENKEMEKQSDISFSQWFEKVTGSAPFPYQKRFAEANEVPKIIDVPTGCGKTATVMLGWLWRRRFHQDDSNRQQTPRRLVYCLPMRVLVEQTANTARTWLSRLALLSKNPTEEDNDKIGVYILKGGEIENDWDIYPERDAIIIGTQDQLLSRALNRGYAMSRYRWPMHFALLNNDCLWVMDEVQLMGEGLATTAQLQAFREKFTTYGPAMSTWMSATFKVEALSTIDFEVNPETTRQISLRLSDEDITFPKLKTRIEALKPIQKSHAKLSKGSEKEYIKTLAKEVNEAHKPASLTLVVLNQVKRAQDVFIQIKKLSKKAESQPNMLLVHSRFRPTERERIQEALVQFDKAPTASGAIVVATQAIEAGVDISARTLFTELAPWSSLVQRFGRCNRRGERSRDDPAQVFWVDIATDDSKAKELLPYTNEELEWSRETLKKLYDAGPNSLSDIKEPHSSPISNVIRRRDIIDLFDTTPDLSGSDIDVSRFIRSDENTDLQVFWREWGGKTPPEDLPAATHEELCSVSINAGRKFLKNAKAYVWDGLDEKWMSVDANNIWPGLTLLLKTTEGGYEPELGWTGNRKKTVEAVQETDHCKQDSFDKDKKTFINQWATLIEHNKAVFKSFKTIKKELSLALTSAPWDELEVVIWGHDVGKLHPVFQNMLLAGLEDKNPRRSSGPWAKSANINSRPERPHFRHELASALALLQNGYSDFAAYLAASHHGKVRLSIRSFPKERVPPDGGRFARGVWEGDIIPSADLGNGIILSETALSLSYMEMGLGEDGPSWLERMLKLRDDYGPFRLSFLETLVRVADWRGSAQTVTKNE
jgi:CRISPR-associated endonuclease/helicase Cas3